MSQPPTTGPIAAKTVVQADQVPMARPRSSSGKDADRMESPWGTSKRGAHTLNGAGSDQLAQGKRGGAGRRGQGKERYSP